MPLSGIHGFSNSGDEFRGQHIHCLPAQRSTTCHLPHPATRSVRTSSPTPLITYAVPAITLWYHRRMATIDWYIIGTAVALGGAAIVLWGPRPG